MPEIGDARPARRSWIRIGFGPESSQAGSGPRGDHPGASPADCNFTVRGDESLAYDLVARYGRVRH